jgi:hypothetical protein
VGVRAPLGPTVTTRKPRLRRDRVLLIELPHLLGVGQAARVRGELSEEAVQVFDVAEEELLRVGVVRRVDRLGKVDEDRPFGADEDVEV